jgi:oligopeptide transport system permease protein
MAKYIVRRLLQMIPVLLGSTFLIFMMVYVLPGDPTTGACGERPCSPAYVQAFHERYNLDKPVLVQYLLYLGNLLQGDLGTSFVKQHLTVTEQLAYRWPTTFKLALIAVIFETVIGILAGVVAGIRKGKAADHTVMVGALLVISVPIFVIGSVCQIVFGLWLGWFPVTSRGGSWYELLMPGLILGSVSVAYVSRLTRTTLVENLRADYVRTARAKGLSMPRAVGIHALRNSLVPVVTYIGADFGVLMGGAIVTERIFAIQGIGGLIFDSIHDRDGVVVVGTVVCLVLVYLLVNLMVDILYGFLDPRISHE